MPNNLPAKIDIFENAVNGLVFDPNRFNTDQTALERAINGVLDDLIRHYGSLGDDHDLRYYTELEIDAKDSALQTQFTQSLETHKSSSDHDGRYYTESEVAMLLLANQQGNHIGTWQGFSPVQTEPGIQAIVNNHTRQISNFGVNVKDFGAVGDGVTDDTVAIQTAINYAQMLVTDRFKNGADVKCPYGTYLISSTLVITSSNINLVGSGAGASVIYAPNANFDLIHFNGAALSLYSVGMKNIRTYTPGNSTAGVHLKLTKVINGFFPDIHSVASYKGLIMDGCGKVFFGKLNISQENRTSGTPSYAIDFLDTNGINSDIHFTDLQIVPDILTAQAYSMSIRACDGLYFENFHMHGGLLIQPNGVGFGQTCASVFFSNSYFDTATDSNLAFVGTASAYRNFFFDTCYFREASKGLFIDTDINVSNIKFSNCTFAQQRVNGLEFADSLASEVSFVGCTFMDNNTNNAADQGDMILNGVDVLVSACIYKGGGALGRAVWFKAGLSKSTILGCNFTESTAAKKFENNGSANKIGLLNGFVAKNKGSGVVLSGSSSVIVAHGISVGVALTGENISITPRSSLSGGVSYWISNVTATNFTINLQVVPSADVTFTWLVDVTN